MRFVVQARLLRKAQGGAEPPRDDESGIDRLVHKALSRLQSLISGTHGLALVDQAVVSGASFATMILLSHWTGPDKLGLYSIGISVLVTYLGIQDSLVSLPYTIQQHLPHRAPAERAGDALSQSVLWSALGSALLATAALIIQRGTDPAIVVAICALAGAVPFALLREFCRRLAFAHLQMKRALALDAATATVQLSALCWLGWTGWMSPASAYAAIGAACALTSMSSLFFSRTDFIVQPRQTWQTTRRSWRLGKWLLASQTIVSAQNYITPWLLALTIGATATGVYAACASVVMFANPLVTGIGNTVAPRAAQALKTGGATNLRREAIGSALLLGSAMLLFCLALMLLGEKTMGLLFRGDAYANRGPVIVALGLAMTTAAIGLPALIGLASMGRPKKIVRAGVTGLVLTVSLVLLLVPRYGVFGAACGYLVGNLVNVISLWVSFLKGASRLNTSETGIPPQSNAYSGASPPNRSKSFVVRESM